MSPSASEGTPSASEADAIPPWWGVARLDRIWGLVAERLERGGLDAVGRVQVVGLHRAERHALSDLVGSPVTTEHLIIDLAVLDERLRLRSGTGVVAAAERLLHRDLVDRGAVRSARRSRLVQSERAAEAWLDAHSDVDWPWTAEWVAAMRRDGFLARSADPSALVVQALTVLYDRRDALAGNLKATPVARTELAARTTYDAHALDPDRPLSSALLRALSTRTGGELPTGAADRRELWESAGVLADAVSSTCLMWNVTTGGPVSLVPRHLTWWDVKDGLAPDRGQRILVCENPRVLEAVAQRGPRGVGVVCTMGRPNLVTQEVLECARAVDSHLDYHGDFDWPGIAMANAAVDHFGAQPLMMSAAAYLKAPASLTLKGAQVEPVWDHELGAAMRQRGLAVHEESVLADIISALELGA